MTQRVLITTQFLHSGDQIDDKLRGSGLETVYSPFLGTRAPGELESLLEGISAVIAGSDPFTEAVLKSATDLKVIARTGVGYDAIDIATAQQLGIAVCNAPGVNRVSVAEHTLGLILAHARNLPSVLQDVREGGWSRPAGSELSGSVLGLVGVGAIGRSVARIAQAFGMQVLGYDPFIDDDRMRGEGVEPATLQQVFERSRYVSLHMALTDETRHLVNADLIGRMRPDGVIVNTARGPIIDQLALVDALESGRIGGAALDVVESEPLPAGHPLRMLPMVTLTPHIGGSTQEARLRSAVVAADSVIDILAGKRPDTLVTAP